jgi:hypothetical protein
MWCLSFCMFVTDTHPLDLLAARSNSLLICGSRWLCERRIHAAPRIWARGQKKIAQYFAHTHVRMHVRFSHPMLSLRTSTGTHSQILTRSCKGPTSVHSMAKHHTFRHRMNAFHFASSPVPCASYIWHDHQ